MKLGVHFKVNIELDIKECFFKTTFTFTLIRSMCVHKEIY